MAVSPPVCDFGAPWHDFALPDAENTIYKLTDVRGRKATLIMFICNHCPYVRSILDRIVRDAHQLMDADIGVVAISANDIREYPQDSPQDMARLAAQHGFRFPYLYDETQQTARLYGAECTPDFFGYNDKGELQYRGRLDASGRSAGPDDAKRELFEAMIRIAQTGQGPSHQIASMGCSIKWKTE